MRPRIAAQVHVVEGTPRAHLEEIESRLGACAREIDGVTSAHAGLHLEGSVGGGDLSWDLSLESEADCRALCARVPVTDPGLLAALGPALADLVPSISRVEAAVLEPIDRHVGARGLAGIKRTLWTRVIDGTPDRAIAEWEREMLLLPEHVPAIRNWCFSRVRAVAPMPGPIRWHHVWEQEYETIDGLNVDYMSSPYHWGFLDTWFDLEHPRCIIEPWLAHLYCPASESVLSWE